MAAGLIAFRAGTRGTLLALLAAVMNGQTGTAPGVGFGLVGIVPGQSVHLNALNLAIDALTDSDISCTVTLKFRDTEGQVLKSQATTLQPGKTASLELRRDEIPSGDDPRVEIGAVVLFGYFGGAPPSPQILKRFTCNIAPSLEVLDNDSRRTVLVVTDAKQLPPPGAIAPSFAGIALLG